MKRSARHFPRASKRRGSILILVLACCAVAVSMVMISLQVSLQQRRQLRSELQLEQTRWVLDAAIRKSIAEPPSEDEATELKPRLEKFDKVTFTAKPQQDGQQIAVQAKIENSTGTDVTSRSARFELEE